MGTRREHKRSNLFLLRLWTEVAEESDGSGGGQVQMQLHGRVQRVVDGESHQFRSWQGLLDLLAAMLSKSSGQDANPAQKDSELQYPIRGNEDESHKPHVS